MPDKLIFFSVIILISIGVISSYSLTSYSTTVIFSTSEYNFAVKQLIYAVLAVIIIWVLSRLDPDKWLKKIGMTLFITSFMMMATMYYLPSSMVTEVGGAKRWIKIFGFSLAPVEFFKVGFVYFLAWSFARKVTHDPQETTIRYEIKLFTPYIILFIIAVFLIAILQNDLGQVVVIGSTLIILVYLAGGSSKFLTMVVFSASFIFFLIIIFSIHRIERIRSWWLEAQNWVLAIFPDSIADKLKMTKGSEPYQVGHSLNAIHNGGFFGTGLGNGNFKMGFLGEVHTDFVLAGIAEELGLVMITVIIFTFILLVQRIFRVANRSSNRVYSLFNSGIALIISFALIINSYGITAIFPIKGIAVPFLSYGGSGLITMAFAIGMVLMTSKKIKGHK
jgi:cell division protein FtsW